MSALKQHFIFKTDSPLVANRPANSYTGKLFLNGTSKVLACKKNRIVFQNYTHNNYNLSIGNYVSVDESTFTIIKNLENNSYTIKSFSPGCVSTPSSLTVPNQDNLSLSLGKNTILSTSVLTNLNQEFYFEPTTVNNSVPSLANNLNPNIAPTDVFSLFTKTNLAITATNLNTSNSAVIAKVQNDNDAGQKFVFKRSIGYTALPNKEIAQNVGYIFVNGTDKVLQCTVNGLVTSQYNPSVESQIFNINESYSVGSYNLAKTGFIRDGILTP